VGSENGDRLSSDWKSERFLGFSQACADEAALSARMLEQRHESSRKSIRLLPAKVTGCTVLFTMGNI
jgi:hypothetical protein